MNIIYQLILKILNYDLMKKKKIIIIIDEQPLHHPDYILGVIEYLKNNDWIINACLIKKNKNKASLNNFFIKKFFLLSFSDKIKLIYLKFYITIFNLIFKKGFNNKYYSVKSVLKKKLINYIEVREDINFSKNINFVKNFQPDIILSSNSQIFSDELINIPNIACINRHSSLLPSYKGLMPVFHAINKNEKYLGVSIHFMTNKIDEGKIISQSKFANLCHNNLNKIYSKIFTLSISCTIEAIEILLNKNKLIRISDNKESYYSTPSSSDLSEFYKKNNSFF
jgi:methionyl-tRNA formyltransferase